MWNCHPGATRCASVLWTNTAESSVQPICPWCSKVPNSRVHQCGVFHLRQRRHSEKGKTHAEDQHDGGDDSLGNQPRQSTSQIAGTEPRSSAATTPMSTWCSPAWSKPAAALKTVPKKMLVPTRRPESGRYRRYSIGISAAPAPIEVSITLKLTANPAAKASVRS